MDICSRDLKAYVEDMTIFFGDEVSLTDRIQYIRLCQTILGEITLSSLKYKRERDKNFEL